MAVVTQEHDTSQVERRTQELGRTLLEEIHNHRPGVFSRRYWEDRFVDAALADDDVRVQAFRFVDVLPALASDDAIDRHLQEYFGGLRNLPWPGPWVIHLAKPGTWIGRKIAQVARFGARMQAWNFIAGTNSEEVLRAAERERRQRRAFTLDVLGEHITSEAEAEYYTRVYCELIEQTAPTVNSWPEIPQIDVGAEGPLPRVNVSIKLTALDSQFDAVDFEGTYRRVAPRLRRLLNVARQHRAYVHFDMENYDKKDLTLAVFKRILLEDEFRDFEDVGIVIQAYLRDSHEDLVELADWAELRGTPVWVRLVKGAYWDYEIVLARQRRWPIPVYLAKWETDANYERCTETLFRAYPHLKAAIASHNVRSLAHAIATAEAYGLSKNAYELQMLYGMADIEKTSLARMGHRVRVYMPYGELIPGMAYLVRRLLENTSQNSFLKASYQETRSAEELLMPPHASSTPVPTKVPAPSVNPNHHETHDMPFENEPLIDFAVSENQAELLSALKRVEKQFGRHEPLVIGGQDVDSGERLESLSPSHKHIVVGTTSSASGEDVNRAVEAARQAQPAWAKLSARERGDKLRRLAGLMSERRFDLAAWIIHESGKPWRQADGDVAEAIDFCRYYAQQAEHMEDPRGRNVPGEANRWGYRPRGVAAVIAPWNFPLAILTGMSTAALATGNSVILKPAEQSPIIAARLMELFLEAGFPPGVVHYLPGKGEVTGAALVEHPDVALIVFTGSRQVGLSIHARAAEISAHSPRPIVKRVIAEMGGKNAIIVDDDADLDEAVAGVVESAFGYAGQKCSACSRAIILEPVYDVFLERLAQAVVSLKVGPAEDPGTRVGPVIDAEAVDRVKRYAQQARDDGFRELASVPVPELAGEGNFVGPHVFADVEPKSSLAQEEVFGPILAVMKAADIDQAIAIANDVDYALTGGIYSRSPGRLDQAAREMEAGNLYLNRNITGAIVARQPFGGYKLSGIGSQAGGPDYLLQFVVPRTITENTIRRGVAPSKDVET
jgi:RHH-type proline utilization regulon transcriptional repressor/proline dehydrogenase/delta 1-pyrroline-5-carboxylate dehydrogenase